MILFNISIIYIGLLIIINVLYLYKILKDIRVVMDF